LPERRDSTDPEHDLTCALMQEQVEGLPLNDQEIASLLRNWTAGEIGTIAAAVGIIAHFLASEPQVQQLLRENPDLLWQANDEIPRMPGPPMAKRSRATCPTP